MSSSKNFNCKCGSFVKYYSRKAHYKTKRHQNYIDNGIVFVGNINDATNNNTEKPKRGRPKTKENSNYDREKYLENRTKFILASTNYRINNKEKYNKYQNNYYNNNHEYRQRKLIQMREYMRKRKLENK